jgi:flavin-dependent dehydrogenase
MEKYQFVIVGGGIAGVTCAESVRSLEIADCLMIRFF